MSTGEIVLILFVYLLLFGAKGLPSVAQTMGKAIYQFRNAARDVQNEIMQSADEIRKEAERSVKLDQLDALREDMNKKKTSPPSQPLSVDPEEHPQV